MESWVFQGSLLWRTVICFCLKMINTEYGESVISCVSIVSACVFGQGCIANQSKTSVSTKGLRLASLDAAQVAPPKRGGK